MSDDASEATETKQEVEPVIATITLTEEDIRAGLAEMSGGSTLRWGLLIAGSAMMGVGMLTLRTDSSGGSSPMLVLFPMAFVLILYAAFYKTLQSRNAKAQIENLRRAGDTNVTYRFDADGMTLRSAGATASVAYRRLVRSRLTKSTVLLYTTPQIAQIIPLRAFSADELDRVRSFLPPDQPAATGARGLGMKRVLILWVVLVVAFLAIWQFLSSPAGR